ncbi:hypothetical protein Glove_197g92 [Diversispora epigaea]|uniref:Uncharacterized protein n=1 Tax=Diversispora epigaea TaxID=1348612 RepID=A0A397INL9_9GLOM|nr:hypothetical protein Glove_197g92 [Diversispora epigaea]
MSKMHNRSIFASAITGLPAFTTPSTSSTSRHTRPETEPTASFVVDEEEERETIPYKKYYILNTVVFIETRKEINISESSMKRLIAKIDSLDKKINSLLKEQIDIKKKLKNIELLSEINNNPDFSKNIIIQVTTNVFKVNIFPSKKNLKKKTENVIRKSFPDIYESMNLQHHSSLFKKIKTKLLEKLQGMRDFQSSPAKINSWKSNQRVKNTYHKLFERRTSESHVFSPWLGSPQLAFSRLGSPRLASSQLVSPQLGSPWLFESPDIPDTTREEGDTTGGDTENVEIIKQ